MVLTRTSEDEVPAHEPGDFADLWKWCRRVRDGFALPPGWMPPEAANEP